MVWQCVEIFNSFFPNSILMHETWQCRKDTYYILVVTDQAPNPAGSYQRSQIEYHLRTPTQNMTTGKQTVRNLI